MKEENSQIQTWAKEALEIELESIKNLKQYIDTDFEGAIELIHNTQGRLILTGIGKSAIIAQKVVATLNSTGTPSIFMHAADAVHGDLGIINKNDIVLCVSYSGETSEIKFLVRFIKKMGNKMIALVGSRDSYLAKMSDYVILTTIKEEACPNNLAPTTSTTAQLLMGDAMAITLLKKRGFTKDDFARFHPGGTLGKKVYLTVADLCELNSKPTVNKNTPMKDVIMKITESRLGIVVVEENKKVIGVITDGDLRRMLQKYNHFDDLVAENIMSANPKTVDKTTLAFDAVALLEKNKISQLVLTHNGTFYGVAHIQDFLREGLI